MNALRLPDHHFLFGSLIVVACSLPLTGAAQIRTDGSLGMPAQSLAGPNYQIPEAIGKRVGGNLFHSFQRFGVNPGESANFTTSSSGLLNVISRVTGGNASQINGLITLTAANGTPAFYLINPAGVTFGANASVTVPGAFYVSTANYLKFPDGNFYADTRSGSTFSSAEPAAFGFLGTTRATISVKDTLIYNKAGNLGVLAGDIEIDHAGLWTEQGDIRLVANGGAAAEIALNGSLAEAGGQLEIRNGSSVFSVASPLAAGGRIDAAAGEMRILSGSRVGTSSTTAMAAGAINLDLGSLEIDGRSTSDRTGISSFAAISDVGKGGDISVSARDSIRILGGGLISSDTYGRGESGNLTVKTGSLQLDGAEHQNGARLTNRASQGNAQLMAVTANDFIELRNASQISSDSFGNGQAGTISLQAGGEIRVLSDSFVASNAYESGNAGTIRMASRELTVDGAGGQLLTQISSQAFYESQGNAGAIVVNTSGALRLLNGGKIVTDANNTGDAGDIRITAGSLLLNSNNRVGLTGIYSSNDFNSTGNSGSVNVVVLGNAQILETAKISSSTWGQGNAGNVVFRAQDLEIDGRGIGNDGIASDVAETSDGHGGEILVTVPGVLKISDGGLVSAASYANGNAGAVNISAGNMVIDGLSSPSTGIRNSNLGSGEGKAGLVSVAVTGNTLLARNGSIRSDTASSGSGGDLTLAFGSDLSLAEGGHITSLTAGAGRAGNIDIRVGGNLTISPPGGTQGALISTLSAGTGDAGNIAIQVGANLNLGVGGMISSETLGAGNAGGIDIHAQRVYLKGGDLENLAWIASDSRGTGVAGSINIQAEHVVELGDAGFISSDTYGSGHAGKVTVSAPEIRIGGPELAIGASITSNTYAGGNAGRVDVSSQFLIIEGGNTVYPNGIASRSFSVGYAGSVNVAIDGAIHVLNGGEISSSTAGAGIGGEVSVQAASITVTGGESQIGAMATATSGGQPGSVTIVSDGLVSVQSGGKLSIANDGINDQPGAVRPTVLTVTTAELMLEDGAILANASGNVAAGALDISVGKLSLTGSRITTSANAGNGGPINIRSGMIDLGNSQITTSVSGMAGNGGDIRLQSDSLIMRSGFIQANTAAPDASGGQVAVDVKVLVPSGSTLFVGGSEPYVFQPGIFGYNVIQAAAPNGLSGTISITSPSLDISSSLGGFGVQMLDGGGLGRNPCRIGAGSSFVQAGRGGFAPSSRDLLGPEPRQFSPGRSNNDKRSRLIETKCSKG